MLLQLGTNLIPRFRRRSPATDVAESPRALSERHGPSGESAAAQWRMPATEKFALIAFAWCVAVLHVGLTTVADPDLWGHTLYGVRAIEQGVLTERSDPFSYTAPNAPWINHEWLTEYQLGWLWMHFGETGLWWWRNAMVLLLFAVAAAALWRARAGVGASVALLAYSAQCLAIFCLFIRPQLATFALFALNLWILRSFWERGRGPAIWLLPAINLVWVNMHGGFLAGVAVQLLFVVAFAARAFWSGAWRSLQKPQAQQWLIVSTSVLLALGATLVNPYGPRLHAMLWDHLVPEQAVREWMPLWAAWQAPMYYVPFLLLALALPFSRRWQWIDLWVLSFVAFQAVCHIRHVALLGIAILLLLPGSLTESFSRLFRHVSRQFSGDRRRWQRGLAVAAIMLTLLALEMPAAWKLWRCGIRPWQIGVEASRNSPGVPVRAAAVILQEDIRGNLVTEYGWGQYALWHLFPRTKLAFDGRYRTIYPPQVERDFLAFRALDRHGPPRAAMLDDYPSEIVLLSVLTPACDYLASRRDWIEIYRDEQAALFVRDLPKFQAVIERAQDQPLTAPPQPTWVRFPGNPLAPTNFPNSSNEI